MRRCGRLIACTSVRVDCSEWTVEVEGDTSHRAVAFTSLVGSLQPGDEVLLNTTAVQLGLGTGGVHFIIAGPGQPGQPAEFAGREAGHILKLRYTPLQLRVRAAEEPGSPYHEAIAAFQTLEQTPCLAAELHSQAGAAAIAARAAAPEARIVLLHLDSAALPLAFSRLVTRLRLEGVLNATVTVGQSFGGDYEAVNVYSGLAAARIAASADLIVMSQGPGNVGTGTRLGFSGMVLVEALHAAAYLGGTPILAPRISQADARARHFGLSHHTSTMLDALQIPVTVPSHVAGLVTEAGRHRVEVVNSDDGWAVLQPYRDVLTTMGRTLDEDETFFRAAASAGSYAARFRSGTLNPDQAVSK